MSFGGLEIRLDPWQVDYGGELFAESLGDGAGGLADAGEAADGEVVTDLEVTGPWQPILPSPGEVPARMVFVDGVRRVEARVVVQRPQGIAHGVFAGYAVGSVEAAGDPAAGVEARFGEPRVERVLLLGSGLSIGGEVAVTPALAFRPASTDEAIPEAPVQEVQGLMRRAEVELARDLSDDGVLVITDGPLGFEHEGAMGYVKRAVRLYLPQSYLGVLARLPAAARTPLFAFSRGGFGRYSWYLRLAARCPGETDFAGLVRLEVADSLDLAAARKLADASCRFLPRFAPGRWQDPRAPQNLVPIAALERQLTHLLGDRLLVRRQIETYLARAEAA